MSFRVLIKTFEGKVNQKCFLVAHWALMQLAELNVEQSSAQTTKTLLSFEPRVQRFPTRLLVQEGSSILDFCWYFPADCDWLLTLKSKLITNNINTSKLNQQKRVTLQLRSGPLRCTDVVKTISQTEAAEDSRGSVFIWWTGPASVQSVIKSRKMRNNKQ